MLEFMKKKRKKKKLSIEFIKSEDLPATKGQLDSRMEIIDERFRQIDHRFDAIDERFRQIDHRFEALEKRVENIEKRLTRLEDKFDQMHQVLLKIAADISDQRRYSTYVLDKYNIVGGQLQNHEERIQQLESPLTWSE